MIEQRLDLGKISAPCSEEVVCHVRVGPRLQQHLQGAHGPVPQSDADCSGAVIVPLELRIGPVVQHQSNYVVLLIRNRHVQRGLAEVVDVPPNIGFRARFEQHPDDLAVAVPSRPNQGDRAFFHGIGRRWVVLQHLPYPVGVPVHDRPEDVLRNAALHERPDSRLISCRPRRHKEAYIPADRARSRRRPAPAAG